MHKFALGVGLGLISWTCWAGAQPAGQQTAGGTPVHMIVSVENHRGGETPDVKREDVMVNEGHDRDKVTSWVAATGDRAGLELYILVDDSASWGVDSQLNELRAFILQQPASTFVAVGYMANGTVQTVQGLTADHTSAAKAVRVTRGFAAGAASPYFSLGDLIKHWQPNPARPRREVVMITNGVDLYSPGSVDPYLDQTIQQAQRAGILVYSIYTAGSGHVGHSFWRSNWGQNDLSQISDESGAESYDLGLAAVVSFKPYFDDISSRLGHQYLLTFLAKPQAKAGMQSVHVSTELPNVELVSADHVYVPASHSD